MLTPTGIEPTPFRNSACKVAGLQVHATTPSMPLYSYLTLSEHSGLSLQNLIQRLVHISVKRDFAK